MSETLFQTITVHCCFCAHVVHRHDPRDAHDAMEDHYADAHTALLDSLVAGELAP